MENQKTKIISIASIIALALTLVTATYAFFVAQTGEGAQTDIKINANTVDTFTFEAGSALNLSLNQENFASGKGNQTGTTFAKAMLSANNKTNTATDHYYMYLNISENTFTYTQDANTPEILLSIKDGSNNEITTLTGLTYKTVTDGKGASIKGFDITNKKGLVTILNNREITTTSSKTEQWNVTVTFVNYNSNQAGNAGKSFSAKLMIQKEKIPTVLSDVCTSGNNLATCITTLSNKSEPSIVNIYHHTSSLANGAGDNSYRYAGASGSVNNYICLGSDEATCPDANLFRIIGVFGDKTKVIRAKSVGDKEWNTSADNTWSSSSLNTYLNGEYLTSLGTLAEKIATTTVDKKIGLMYVSDYGFAADSSGWTTKLSSYNSNNSKNWLYLGSNEWTISRNSGTASNAFDVFSGYVLNRNVIISYAVRPSFNLESSVKYVSGSGSMSDPVRVN